MKTDNYSLLLEKLDLFIRKYYFNKLIRGVLYSIALLFAFFLFIALAEYRFYFSPFLRKMLFFSFLITSFLAILFLVIVPILNIQKLGKIISHRQAAEIIGQHFSTVKDKLINILQLHASEVNLEQAALVEASIHQKSLELKPVPFESAIDLSKNQHYLKFALPPLLLFVALLFLKPNILKESTNRLIQNDIVFEKPMPFQFVIQEDSLKTIQYEDYLLAVKMEGEAIPQEIFIYRKTKNNEYIKNTLQKLNTTNFNYLFTNIEEETHFYLEANGFRSKDYFIAVNQKPMITQFLVEIKYPAYLNKANETLKNIGDITVPFGAAVKWIFDATATEKINMQFSGALFSLEMNENKQFIFSKTLKENDKYIVKTFNKNVTERDSLQFNISVVFDEFPKINVNEFADSTQMGVFYYVGEIADDYGLKQLFFHYQIQKENGTKEKMVSTSIPFEKGSISDFTYFWNMKTLGLEPGDKLTYYFEVWDNDGVNGSKATKSKWMVFEVPSLSKLEDNTEKELDEIKKELEKAIEKSKTLQDDLKNMKNKLLNKKELSWEDKKQMQNMIDEQKKLQENINKLNEKLKENIQTQNEYKEVNPEIARKQEQIQKLFDEVLNEEMKKLIEKYEEMLKNINKENALEKMEEMKVNDEELEKELDRMLEMLKKLEFEQKMQETQEKLEKLAEEQEKLSKDTKKTNEEKQKEQEKLNDAFDELKKDIADLEKQDDELGDKTNFDELKEDAEQTDNEMQKASEQLDKQKESKAAENQQNAADKMKEMADKMQQMNMKMQSKSLEEDMKSLRQLLENLISLSFSEERLIDQLKETTINTPKYTQLIQEQNKLIDNAKSVEDSLYALAKRVIQIESIITEKMLEINRNLKQSVNYLEDRVVQKALVNQQYVMTGFNDLALMLSEVLQQMQQQMAQQMEGNQSCEKPGNGKPKPGKLPSLKQMQQQLSDQINKMGEQMKNGEGKPGEKSGNSEQSKELAKMAAKQQAIREALQKIKDSDTKGENGKGSLGDLQKIIDQMEQNETDIVNKRISQELINRQKDILTRLLQAENAEHERDEKEERKAEVAKEYRIETPPALKKYLEERQSSLSIYKATQPQLKSYYRRLSEKYFKKSISN